MQSRSVSVVAVWILGCSTPSKPPTTTTADGPECVKALLFVDEDQDGVGDSNRPEEACVNTLGYAEDGGDCDDTNPAVSPLVTEACNGIDDDCDGTIDRGLLIDVWSDLDGDGFGDPDTQEQVCAFASFHVRDASDCDDTDPAVHPDGIELCDGIDQDCDGRIDEEAVDRVALFSDLDGDGMGDPTAPLLACAGVGDAVDNDWDCDDGDPNVPVVVDAGASGVGTLESPLGTIQEGVDAVMTGEGEACVRVMGGRYPERVDLSAGDVSVVGVMGPEWTVVDGFGLDGPVLTLGPENQDATLVEGLTLTNGSPLRTVTELTIAGARSDRVRDAGAGVYASGARATLRDVYLLDNHIEDPALEDYLSDEGAWVSVQWLGLGGGIFSEEGTLVLEGCRLVGNSAQEGGGIFSARSLVVQQTEFLDNVATSSGGAVAASGAVVTLENAVFAGNMAPDGPTASVVDSALLMSQITVKEDVPESVDGALITVERVVGLWTNLLFSAASGDGVRVDGAGSSINVEGVLVDLEGELKVAEVGAVRVLGTVMDAPVFVAFSDNGVATDDDLHLDAGSPGVDAGLDGRDPDGSPADLGAYGGVFGDW